MVLRAKQVLLVQLARQQTRELPALLELQALELQAPQAPQAKQVLLVLLVLLVLKAHKVSQGLMDLIQDLRKHITMTQQPRQAIQVLEIFVYLVHGMTKQLEQYIFMPM